MQRELTPKAAEGLFYRKSNLYNPSVTLTRATSLYTREAFSYLPEGNWINLSNLFTNRKNCDIIIMPNNLNIHSYRSFSLYGITIAFFAIQLSKHVLVKMLLLLDCIENLCYEEIVWRQLELAFFGALTSVGALFVRRKPRDSRVVQ